MRFYVEVFAQLGESGVYSVPLETVIALFVYEYCNRPFSNVTLVRTTECNSRPSFNMKIAFSCELLDKKELKQPVNLCIMPLIVACDGSLVVTGLCAALRQILKTSDLKHPLLGFKQSCLHACAEFSVWTKFCEVDIVKTVNDVFLKADWTNSNVEIPPDMARFEKHMSQPVRIHNVQKFKQDCARDGGFGRCSGLADSRLDLLPDVEHSYAEGPRMSLADVMLFPCFYLILSYIGSVFLKQNIPLTYQWFENVFSDESIAAAVKTIARTDKKFASEIYIRYTMPIVPNQSLFKSDSKRYKPKNQLYTRQEDIDVCFDIVSELEVDLQWQGSTFGSDVKFDCASVPFDAQPEGGQLPAKRSERKRQQLENLTKAALKIAQHDDVIVDFCSGAGHLGLILAHSLPRCTVILLENKEESLKRARERAFRLKLSNIFFCQGNIDYFCGNFTIGVSLHACGVATDIVMERCIMQNAAFICCPCCYGNIQPNHVISYPRSNTFRLSRLELRDYLVLGHSSDQTHDEYNTKTSQGNKCMGLIDTDRCLRATEANYFVSLSKLTPTSCTPKNNLLVGIPMTKKLQLFGLE